MSMYSAYSLPDQLSLEGLEMVGFHGYAMSAIVFIGFIVVLFMGVSFFYRSFFLSSHVYGSNWLEAIWSITPMFVLLVLTLPSVSLLYVMEGLFDPVLSCKATGHQWYWSYESSEVGFEFDSYMLTSSSLEPGLLRLLEVDNSLVLPVGTDTKLVTTSTDVIHSWSLPVVGLKVDAVPGRLNVLNLHSIKCSSYYGQCSEICGINHSFMPIHVEFVDWVSFLKYNEEQ